jgi:transcriptional regulator with XRE-family HTH domain
MKQKKSRHPTDVHVGSRVRMRRLMLDMSQEKLGDALGIAASLFSRFRNTRRA